MSRAWALVMAIEDSVLSLWRSEVLPAVRGLWVRLADPYNSHGVVRRLMTTSDKYFLSRRE